MCNTESDFEAAALLKASLLLPVHNSHALTSPLFLPSAQPWTPGQGSKWPSRSCTDPSSRSSSPRGPTGSWGSSSTWNMKMWDASPGQSSRRALYDVSPLVVMCVSAPRRWLVCWTCLPPTSRWTPSTTCKCHLTSLPLWGRVAPTLTSRLLTVTFLQLSCSLKEAEVFTFCTKVKVQITRVKIVLW